MFLKEKENVFTKWPDKAVGFIDEPRGARNITFNIRPEAQIHLVVVERSSTLFSSLVMFINKRNDISFYILTRSKFAIFQEKDIRPR